MNVVIHSANKLDAVGKAADFWAVLSRDGIVATGVGDAWLDHAAGAEVVDAGSRTLVPGLVDIHAHGGGGHSFEDGPTSMAAALQTHRAHGTTRSVISLVSNPIEVLADQLAAVAELTAADSLVIGAHLEGPFLAPARKGAHNVTFLGPPTPAAVGRLLEAAGGALRQMTLAVEWPGILDGRRLR